MYPCPPLMLRRNITYRLFCCRKKVQSKNPTLPCHVDRYYSKEHNIDWLRRLNFFFLLIPKDYRFGLNKSVNGVGTL